MFEQWKESLQIKINFMNLVNLVWWHICDICETILIVKLTILLRQLRLNEILSGYFEW